MADKTITGIVTWLKGWFYTKDEITTKENALQTQINNKASQSDLNTLSSTVSGKADSVHTHSSTDVTEASALSHIGTSANASQHDVNSAIDTLIGNLTGADILKVVPILPTASASTQNALYLLNNDGQYDIYITIDDDGRYYWDELDDDVLSDLSVNWSDINNIPSSFTPSSHTHGNITNDGKITVSTTVASGDYIVISDASQSSKLNRVSNILASQVVDGNGYPNIGSSADTNQHNINYKIDYKIGQINTSLDGKASKSQVIDWDSLTFVAKADDDTGAITFDYLE